MSMWTHITACLSVDTCWNKTRQEMRKELRSILKMAPKITGSERDADVFVNIQSGYNTSVSCDCAHCEYGSSVLYSHSEEGWTCDGPKGYDCPDGKFQSCVVISIQGDLRDRMKEQTQREFDEFKEFIKTYFIIRDYSINIEGE